MTAFRYIGSGSGRGEVHVVIYRRGDEIITTSGTHSWLGSASRFRKDFEQVALGTTWTDAPQET